MDEEDSKPPASSSTTPPRDDDDCDDAPIAQQKRRKDNSGRAVVEKDGGGEEDAEVYDVAEVQGFRPGDRFEVKWTIFGDNEDAAAADRIGGGGGEAKEEVDGSAVEDHDGGGGDAVDGEDGGVTVWWAATLVQKTDRMHDLADDERGEGTTSVDDEDSPRRRRSAATASVRVPIYKLTYAPLEGKDSPPPPRFVSSCLSVIFASFTVSPAWLTPVTTRRPSVPVRPSPSPRPAPIVAVPRARIRLPFRGGRGVHLRKVAPQPVDGRDHDVPQGGHAESPVVPHPVGCRRRDGTARRRVGRWDRQGRLRTGPDDGVDESHYAT